MSITKKIAINTLGFLVIAWFVPQFYVTNWVAALVASIVLAVLNLFVKPILFLLTLPVTIVTFGCFKCDDVKLNIIVCRTWIYFCESIHYLSGERSVNDFPTLC